MYNMNVGFLIIICWAIFGLYWLAASRRVKRTTVVGQKRSVRAFALVSLAICIALLGLPLSSIPVLGLRLIPASPLFPIVGLVLCAAGVFFAIRSRRVLADNWSGAVTLKEGHSLVKHGPYAVVRHPIYLGGLLAFFGTALAVGEIRAFLAFGLCLFGLLKKMSQEEELLRNAFPVEYSNCERTVKRLLPGIW